MTAQIIRPITRTEIAGLIGKTLKTVSHNLAEYTYKGHKISELDNKMFSGLPWHNHNSKYFNYDDLRDFVEQTWDIVLPVVDDVDFMQQRFFEKEEVTTVNHNANYGAWGTLDEINFIKSVFSRLAANEKRKWLVDYSRNLETRFFEYVDKTAVKAFINGELVKLGF